MEEALVMIVSLPKERILQGRAVLAEQPPDRKLLVLDYDVLNVSEKVVRIILSYTDCIKHRVWREE